MSLLSITRPPSDPWSQGQTLETGVRLAGSVSEPVLEIEGQLISTRRGGHWWTADDRLRPCMSAAPYCPWVAAVIIGARVHWGPGAIKRWGTFEDVLLQVYSSDPGLGVQELVVRGSNALDLHRRVERRQTVQRAVDYVAATNGDGQPILSQGHLTAHHLGRLGEWTDDGEFVATPEMHEIFGDRLSVLLTRDYSGVPVLFNHEAIGVRWAIRADNAILLEAYPSQAEGGLAEGCRVLSPHHPWEPLALRGGVWLLTHPVPSSRGGVD